MSQVAARQLTMCASSRETTSRRSGVAAPRAATLAAAAFLLAALVAVGLALSGSWGEWPAIQAAAGHGWRIRPLYLATALVCAATALLCSGAVWGALFRAGGGEMDRREAVAAWIGSNLGRYLPGKVWQVAGLVGYVRSRGGPGAAALSALLVSQASLLSVAAAASLATLGAAAFAGMGPWAAVLGVLGVAAAFAPPVLRAAVRLGARLLREPAGSAAISASYGLRTSGRTAAASLLVWCLHGLGFWFLIKGLVAEIPVGPSEAAGVYAAAYLAGYLALIAPGGIVVREGAIVTLLGLVASVPPGPAAALALAARIWSTCAEVAAFGAAAAVAGLAARRPGGCPGAVVDR